MSRKGYAFESTVTGGSVPREYWKAIDEGIQGSLNRGILGGYEVADITANLYDGSYHEVDQMKWHLNPAASMAFKEAMRESKR